MEKVKTKARTLAETYQKIRPSIVAITSKVSSNPDFPEIIGTGFVIDTDGLIVTCDHVIDVIKSLPRRKNAPPEEWPISVALFYLFPEGMASIHMEVVGVVKPKGWKRGFDYAPKLPDIGLIRVSTFNLPALNLFLSMEELQEGKRVALSGFPMGTDTLRAPGWIHQFTPTLQEGIISAVLPFPCANPHALLVNIMTQGGSSGSPVFDPETGSVIGMIDAGLIDTYKVGGKKNDAGIFIYNVPTTLTAAIPSKILGVFINAFKDSKDFKKHDFKKKDLKATLRKAQAEAKKGKIITVLQPADPGEIIVPQKRRPRSKK